MKTSSRRPSSAALLLVAVAAVAVRPAAAASVQHPAQEASSWSVQVVDRRSGAPLDGVRVAFPDYGVARFTDGTGTVPGQGSRRSIRIVVVRLGYADMDTTVVIPRTGGKMVQVGLDRAAIALPPLTVAAERRTTSRELHRLMFDREVAVGAIGITQTEIQAVPPVGEPDVFRSLQAFAGVSSVNDMTGQLFVRGGGADQVAVLVDGAPVFGPYHMLGLFGTFNPEAVESVEFFRGSVPARYGGSLSGVLSATQHMGGSSGTRLRGGLSVLGLRVTADGALPWGGVRWLAAGRRASVDVARLGMPYSFQDMNLGVEVHPGEEHRVRLSAFASTDNFEWDSEGPSGFGSFRSEWSNVASSLSWAWARGDRISSRFVAYHSRYRGSRTEGAAEAPIAGSATTSRIGASGARAGLTVRGEHTGFRAGVALEQGPVQLIGSEQGGYAEGAASGSYLHATAFVEGERWIGPLRLAPGVRVGSERRSAQTFVEPRLSLRWRMSSFAVSASLDRNYQFISVLRDAYSLVPGARMWFLHGEKQPAAVADGASVSVDAWKGDDWTATVAGWARRFRGTPHWRPAQSRTLSELEFHDGTAHGVDATVQKHGGRLRGWVSYQWAKVKYSDRNGDEYYPQWDRRHEAEGVLAADVLDDLTLSLRATVGSGAPFWFPAGGFSALRFDPLQSPGPPNYWTGSDQITIWSNAQARVPTYARYDLAVRYSIRWGSWSLTPYASVVNATGRENILHYEFVGYRNGDDESSGWGDPWYQQQLPLVPFVGIDFSF